MVACAILLCVLNATAFPEPERIHYEVVTAGAWSAQIEVSVRVGDKVGRPSRYRICRRGPEDETPDAILDWQQAHHRPSCALRDDGLLVVSENQLGTYVYFPGSPAGVRLDLPPLQLMSNPDSVAAAASCLGTMWLINDVLFFSRQFKDGHQMGYFRIEDHSKTISPATIIFEQGTTSREVIDAAQVDPRIGVLRCGNLLAWIVAGRRHPGDATATPPSGRRKTIVQVFDTANNRLCTGSALAPIQAGEDPVWFYYAMLCCRSSTDEAARQWSDEVLAELNKHTPVARALLASHRVDQLVNRQKKWYDFPDRRPTFLEVFGPPIQASDHETAPLGR